MTTWTITSTTPRGGETCSIWSRVEESAGSALDHLQELVRYYGEPVVVLSAGCWRWSWEGVSEGGSRWSVTVRVR